MNRRSSDAAKKFCFGDRFDHGPDTVVMRYTFPNGPSFAGFRVAWHVAGSMAENEYVRRP